MSNGVQWQLFVCRFEKPRQECRYGPTDHQCQALIMFMEIQVLRESCCQIKPTAFAIIQVETGNAVDRTECWRQRKSIFEKMTKQRRDRQRKYIVQDARTSNCRHSLGLLILGVIGTSGQRSLQKESHLQDSIVALVWSSRIVLFLPPHMCNAVPVNFTKSDKGSRAILCREDPRVVNTGIRSGKISQENT